MSEGNSVTYLPPGSGCSKMSSFASLNTKEFSPLKPGRPGQLLRGPRRVARLCVFALLVPAVLITVPLYVRLILYPPGHYPMMPTDQRLIARHVSPFWCQAQTTHMNGSFTGYLKDGSPGVGPERRSHTMLHHLKLKDDIKEYWGFYLLKGSTITISSCARWDGGQLMILRGLQNLKRCAWIGEADSAEDMAEDDDEQSNERHRLEEILRQGPRIISPGAQEFEVEEQNQDEQRNGNVQNVNTDTNTGNIESTTPHLQSEERKQSIKELLREAIRMSKNKKEILRILHTEGKNPNLLFKDQVQQIAPVEKIVNTSSVAADAAENIPNENVERTENSTMASGDTDGIKPADKKSNTQNKKQSRKLKEEMRQGKARRQNMRRQRKKGNRRLENLTEEELETGRRITKEDLETGRRQRRAIQLEDDQENADGAFEELDTEDVLNVLMEAESPSTILSPERAVGGLINFPKGLKFERGKFNQTTQNDNSREEHVSSYSSSEEALASCEGVIMAWPLLSFRSCSFDNNLEINRMTYDIPITGTYYFVFSSDNEIYVNDLFFNITMQRVVYNVTASEKVCTNVTDCTMSLKLWSDEQAVVEVPQEPGWDNAYVLDTKCEPRVYVYLTFLLLVPLCIMCCAFH